MTPSTHKPLPDEWEIVEDYTPSYEADRWIVLCKGYQWGKGPRDLSGCSSETWPTYEDARQAIYEREGI